MKYLLMILVLFVTLVFSSCTDWRTDAFEDKRFDVENSFIRFNYGYVLNQGAQDSLILDLGDFQDTILLSIPIAISSPLQQDTIRVQLQQSIVGNTGNMQVVWPNGLFQEETTEVDILPNELEVQLDIQIWEPEPADILFEIIENSADLHLGFPESGANSTFKVILQ